MKNTEFSEDKFLEIIIKPEKDNAGKRLDVFLTEKMKRFSRSRIQRLIKRGYIRLNGEKTKISKVLTGSETIFFYRLLPEEDELPPIPLIFKNENFVVFNKPSDLTVHPTANSYKKTLTEFLKINYPEYTPSHRLDRETSGVLLCAVKGNISSRIKKLFAEGNITKVYLALLKGNLKNQKVIDKNIIDDQNSPIRIKMTASGEAGAKTVFIPLKASEKATLAAAIPFSGKQHQIRVHAEYADMPLWGDKIYGVSPDIFLNFIKEGFSEKLESELIFNRHMLHAALLRFHDPFSDSVKTFFAGIPDDFKNATKLLGLDLPSELENLLRKISETVKTNLR